MADTLVSSGNKVTQWDSRYFQEYHRESQFEPFTGTGKNSVIQVKDISDDPGATMSIPLITRLSGDGVTGNTTLEGNEEDLSNYSDAITATYLRNAVLITKEERMKTAIDLRNAAKEELKMWSMEALRDTEIDRFYSPCLDGVTTYANASEAQKDAWCAANADRILFGATISNYNADHSVALSNVDNTNDKLTTGRLSLMKRMAKAASPRIRPIRVDRGGEIYVVFVNTYQFRDLKNDSVMQQANREAMARGKDNPIFVDGSLLWDGMVIIEVPEIASVSNGAIQVAPVFFCGAQALGILYKQRVRTIVENRDYNFRYGVAVEEARGIKKLIYNNKQHGMITGYFAAVADA